jgi:Ca2+-binding EF-hand superfamily protein
MSVSSESSDENYELSEALLIKCKQSFSLFDLNTSGRIQAKLVQKYLSSVEKTDMIHYMLSGIETLGEEVSFERFLSHVKEKLKNSLKLEAFQGVARFMDDHVGKEIKIYELSDLAKTLGFSLDERELKGVIEQLEISDSLSENSKF